MENQDLDRLSRRLIRAIEPELRSHLGVAGFDLDLIGELYLSLRQSLLRWVDSRTDEDPGGQQDLVDELALGIYLVVAARQASDPLGPAILESLRRAIVRTAAEAGLLVRGRQPQQQERKG